MAKSLQRAARTWSLPCHVCPYHKRQYQWRNFINFIALKCLKNRSFILLVGCCNLFKQHSAVLQINSRHLRKSKALIILQDLLLGTCHTLPYHTLNSSSSLRTQSSARPSERTRLGHPCYAVLLAPEPFCLLLRMVLWCVWAWTVQRPVVALGVDTAQCKGNCRAPPTPPVGSRHSYQPAVKLHISPLVWIFPLGKG